MMRSLPQPLLPYALFLLLFCFLFLAASPAPTHALTPPIVFSPPESPLASASYFTTLLPDASLPGANTTLCIALCATFSLSGLNSARGTILQQTVALWTRTANARGGQTLRGTTYHYLVVYADDGSNSHLAHFLFAAFAASTQPTFDIAIGGSSSNIQLAQLSALQSVAIPMFTTDATALQVYDRVPSSVSLPLTYAALVHGLLPNSTSRIDSISNSNSDSNSAALPASQPPYNHTFGSLDLNIDRLFRVLARVVDRLFPTPVSFALITRLDADTRELRTFFLDYYNSSFASGSSKLVADTLLTFSMTSADDADYDDALISTLSSNPSVDVLLFLGALEMDFYSLARSMARNRFSPAFAIAFSVFDDLDALHLSAFDGWHYASTWSAHTSQPSTRPGALFATYDDVAAAVQATTSPSPSPILPMQMARYAQYVATLETMSAAINVSDSLDAESIRTSLATLSGYSVFNFHRMHPTLGFNVNGEQCLHQIKSWGIEERGALRAPDALDETPFSVEYPVQWSWNLVRDGDSLPVHLSGPLVVLGVILSVFGFWVSAILAEQLVHHVRRGDRSPSRLYTVITAFSLSLGALWPSNLALHASIGTDCTTCGNLSISFNSVLTFLAAFVALVPAVAATSLLAWDTMRVKRAIAKSSAASSSSFGANAKTLVRRNSKRMLKAGLVNAMPSAGEGGSTLESNLAQTSGSAAPSPSRTIRRMPSAAQLLALTTTTTLGVPIGKVSGTSALAMLGAIEQSSEHAPIVSVAVTTDLAPAPVPSGLTTRLNNPPLLPSTAVSRSMSLPVGRAAAALAATAIVGKLRATDDRGDDEIAEAEQPLPSQQQQQQQQQQQHLSQSSPSRPSSLPCAQPAVPPLSASQPPIEVTTTMANALLADAKLAGTVMAGSRAAKRSVSLRVPSLLSYDLASSDDPNISNSTIDAASGTAHHSSSGALIIGASSTALAAAPASSHDPHPAHGRGSIHKLRPSISMVQLQLQSSAQSTSKAARATEQPSMPIAELPLANVESSSLNSSPHVVASTTAVSAPSASAATAACKRAAVDGPVTSLFVRRPSQMHNALPGKARSRSASVCSAIRSNATAARAVALCAPVVSALSKRLSSFGMTPLTMLVGVFLAGSIVGTREVMLAAQITNASFEPTAAVRVLLGALAWLLSSVSLTILFRHRTRRPLGALLLSACVLADFTCIVFTSPLRYSPTRLSVSLLDSWRASALLGPTALILLASLVGGASGLAFIALQFNRIQLSQHTLTSSMDRLRERLAEANLEKVRLSIRCRLIELSGREAAVSRELTKSLRLMVNPSVLALGEPILQTTLWCMLLPEQECSGSVAQRCANEVLKAVAQLSDTILAASVSCSHVAEGKTTVRRRSLFGDVDTTASATANVNKGVFESDAGMSAPADSAASPFAETAYPQVNLVLRMLCLCSDPLSLATFYSCRTFLQALSNSSSITSRLSTSLDDLFSGALAHALSIAGHPYRSSVHKADDAVTAHAVHALKRLSHKDSQKALSRAHAQDSGSAAAAATAAISSAASATFVRSATLTMTNMTTATPASASGTGPDNVGHLPNAQRPIRTIPPALASEPKVMRSSRPSISMSADSLASRSGASSAVGSLASSPGNSPPSPSRSVGGAGVPMLGQLPLHVSASVSQLIVGAPARVHTASSLGSTASGLAGAAASGTGSANATGSVNRAGNGIASNGGTEVPVQGRRSLGAYRPSVIGTALSASRLSFELDESASKMSPPLSPRGSTRGSPASNCAFKFSSLPYQPTLQHVLLHPFTVELLKDELVRSHCGENVLFLQQLQTWRGVKQPALSRALALLLCKQFIEEGSAFEVNVQSSVRQPILQQAHVLSSSSSRRVSTCMFDAAERDVLGLIVSNNWKSFVRSSAYNVCAHVLCRSAVVTTMWNAEMVSCDGDGSAVETASHRVN